MGDGFANEDVLLQDRSGAHVDQGWDASVYRPLVYVVNVDR